MVRLLLASVVISALSLTVALASNRAVANDDIVFPANYSQFVLYATYNEAGNRPELLATGQLRELYASRATLEAAKAGGPLPDGTVLVRVRYDVARDAKGEPIQDAQGQMSKARLLGFGVMEKRARSPNSHPEGEWRYRGFTADRQPNHDGIQPEACFACHLTAKHRDFVFSYERLVSANK